MAPSRGGTGARSETMFYGTFTDEQKAFFRKALEELRGMFGPFFAQDNLIAFGRSAGFLTDPRFAAAFGANARTDQEKSLAWRLHTLVWAARHCLHVAGDFVECGVYKGFSSAVVADYLSFQTIDRRFYLYDTFTGIPEAYDSENRRAAEAAYFPPNLYEEVCERFSGYPNVVVVRGVVPDVFAEVVPEKIAYLHVDMNAAKSEIAALEHLFDRVSAGGIIVFDDYGWRSYAAQKTAEDRFMAERDYAILELPTGQGLMLKR